VAEPLEHVVADVAGATVTRRPFTDDELRHRQHEEDVIAWERLRDERNRLLRLCDWTQTVDSPVDQKAWAAYRQKLRDLPQKTEDPAEARWPKPPS
jgi:hypothetical protein